MWLLDSSPFITRDHCAVGGWPEYLKAFNIYSNFVTFISYIVIGVLLFYFWLTQGRKLPKSNIIYLFGLFILFCGITHLDDIIVFYYPAYRLFTLIDFITCIFSLFTAISLWPVISFIKFIPSINDLTIANEIAQKELAHRQLIEAEHEKIISELTASVQQLELELHRYKWVDKKYENIEKIKKLLEESEWKKDLNPP